MRRRLTALLLAGVTALVPPAVAFGQDGEGTNAPPGLSGADQYLETVPNADGNRSVRGGGRPDPKDPTVKAEVDATLPKATAKAAEGDEATGEAAALAARTSPGPRRDPSTPPGVGGASGAGSTGPSGSQGIAPLPGRKGSNLATIGRVVSGSSDDGMGFLFPLLIVGGTLLVAGSALWRRRDGFAP